MPPSSSPGPRRTWDPWRTNSPRAILLSLLTWLRDRIHCQGQRLWARPLVREVTGVDLQPRYLVRYLQRKFGALYDFPAGDF